MARLVAHRKAMTTLCATTRKDLAAILRRHALTEAVLVAALAAAGLESALHDSVLLVPYPSDRGSGVYDFKRERQRYDVPGQTLAPDSREKRALQNISRETVKQLLGHFTLT